MEKIGFIVLRHVNSEYTNNYWNHCYRCIRKYYPEIPILIIDDNSNYDYINEQQAFYKVCVVRSGYPGRGELLPYVYFLHLKPFDTAIIIHDSVFVNSYIDFSVVDNYKMIWEFEHKWDQPEDEMMMIDFINDEELRVFYNNRNLWKGCFGGMSVITHDYLTHINSKYDICRLLYVVRNRYNRCSFERIIACLLQIGDNSNSESKSLLGNIQKYCDWGISFDIKDNYTHLPLIKVWTGR